MAAQTGGSQLYLVPERETARFIFAFLLALGLHGFLIWVLPRLEQEPLTVPLRIQVEMSQLQQMPSPSPVAEPEPDQPQTKTSVPEPVVPKPVQRKEPQPLLAAKDESPDASFQIPETSIDAEPDPVVPEPTQATSPTAPSSTSAQASESAADATASSGSPVAGALSLEAEPKEAWDGYGQLLHDMVSRNKNYPQMAVRRNWQGVAMVSARFVRGQLVAITLLDPSSGHKVLDDAAMEMLKKAVNALPVKGDLAKKSFTVIVPVDFKLES